VNFRARLTLALLVIAIVPLAIVGYGVRREMTARLDAEAARRVSAVRGALTSGLTATIVADRAKLQSLASDLAADNRFRIGLTGEESPERRWLLDWARGSMKLAGFAVLQIQDSAGRVLSSGQFRNDFDHVAPELPARDCCVAHQCRRRHCANTRRLRARARDERRVYRSRRAIHRSRRRGI